MHISTVASLLTLAGAAIAQTTSTHSNATHDAPVTENNPTDTHYESLFTQEGKVRGSLKFHSKDGKGVDVMVDLRNFPKEGGPFLYHIHAHSVPSDGNCTGTLAHQDPYGVGEQAPCDSEKPETCQTGDLSGKWGTISGIEYKKEYLDEYISTRPEDPAYIGGLSITVHLNNKTRIACANITMAEGSPTTGPSPATNTSEPSGPAVPPPSEGSAAALGVAPMMGCLAMAAIAAFLL